MIASILQRRQLRRRNAMQLAKSHQVLQKDILVSQSLALCINSAAPSIAAKSFLKRHMKMCKLCGTLFYVYFS